MADSFDKDFWEAHWHDANDHGVARELAVNPHLAREVRNLTPGTALDAGCGQGAEAIWLANAGWQVTAVDISAEALVLASKSTAGRTPGLVSVEWVEADLSIWEPDGTFDLVTTHYAHPSTSQLDFYERISGWVAPGGTLLIVGHLHTDRHHHDGHSGGHHPPEEVSITAASISTRLDNDVWDLVTADEVTRTLTNRASHSVRLDDVVVSATRLR